VGIEGGVGVVESRAGLVRLRESVHPGRVVLVTDIHKSVAADMVADGAPCLPEASGPHDVGECRTAAMTIQAPECGPQQKTWLPANPGRAAGQQKQMSGDASHGAPTRNCALAKSA
jgi:hypothetical protein